MHWGNIPDDIARRLDKIGSSDLVVALPGCADTVTLAEAARAWSEALEAWPAVSSALILHADPAAAGADPGIATPRTRGPELVYAPLAGADRVDTLTAGFADTVRGVLQVAGRLQAKAVCVLGTIPAAPPAVEIRALVEPVIREDVDLMVPCYDTGPADGLLGRSILYPLTRALFGRRLQDPMVLNFAASARLAARFNGKAGGRAPQAIWMANEAACAGLPIGQACMRRPAPGRDSADLAEILRAVLGSLFLDIERLAACWHRAQGSKAVPTSGEVLSAPAPPAAPVETDRLVESFGSAVKNLADVWSAVLTPAGMLELKKLAQAPARDFRMPDLLWSRVVYDVALAFRLRVINRDHLLSAFVPLYLAWVASWVRQAGDGQAAPNRQERLCEAFEQQKAYFLSRWRWPDRFSP